MIKNAENKGIVTSIDSGEVKVLTYSKVFGFEKRDMEKKKAKTAREEAEKKAHPSGWTEIG